MNINFDTLTDKTKKLRVWWNSNGNNTYYYIDSPQEAQLILARLSIREMNDDSIVLNAGGLEEFVDNEWSEWYNDEGLDINEYAEEREKILFQKYEKVRASGKYNMITECVKARQEANISEDEYSFVISCYSKLKERYGDK